jgi:hypothetical protein
MISFATLRLIIPDQLRQYYVVMTENSIQLYYFVPSIIGLAAQV